MLIYGQESIGLGVEVDVEAGAGAEVGESGDGRGHLIVSLSKVSPPPIGESHVRQKPPVGSRVASDIGYWESQAPNPKSQIPDRPVLWGSCGLARKFVISGSRTCSLSGYEIPQPRSQHIFGIAIIAIIAISVNGQRLWPVFVCPANSKQQTTRTRTRTMYGMGWPPVSSGCLHI